MLMAYKRVCAYVCVYIEPVTGASTVDHMVPKSSAWNRAYEWSNYRLACAFMNACKGEARGVLDPSEIHDGWFELELTAFQLRPAPHLLSALTTRIEQTITRLKLNAPECRGLREQYAVAYWEGDISLRFLARRAPHVARELRRQGRLNAGDH